MYGRRRRGPRPSAPRSGCSRCYSGSASSRWPPARSARGRPAPGLLVTLLLVLPYAGLWLLVSLQLPHRGSDWKALVPGALLCGLGIEAAPRPHRVRARAVRGREGGNVRCDGRGGGAPARPLPPEPADRGRRGAQRNALGAAARSRRPGPRPSRLTAARALETQTTPASRRHKRCPPRAPGRQARARLAQRFRRAIARATASGLANWTTSVRACALHGPVDRVRQRDDRGPRLRPAAAAGVRPRGSSPLPSPRPPRPPRSTSKPIPRSVSS